MQATATVYHKELAGLDGALKANAGLKLLLIARTKPSYWGLYAPINKSEAHRSASTDFSALSWTAYLIDS